MTAIVPATDAGLALAATALREGRPVVIPTETVYGLAADATSPDAVASVFAAKSRPSDDPLIVHVAPGLLPRPRVEGLVTLGVVAEDLEPAQRATADALVDAFWPGPLTLVLPRGPAIPLAVTSRLESVAIRMPAHPVARAVIEAAGRPLVAPSANLFGRISPTTAEAAQSELEGRIGLVVDGGRCDVGVESTVVRVDADGGLGLLRPGAVTRVDLERVAGTSPYDVQAAEGIAGSPGRLLRHYAPSTPLVIVGTGPSGWQEPRWADLRRRLAQGTGRLGYIAWSSPSEAIRIALGGASTDLHVRTLAPDGTVAEAAHSLYAVLRELDELKADLLVVERPPGGGGLADAVADRLGRAAHGTPPLA
ncbi:MAG: threonylcarbamoyl-AMP synthase [Alphaproteobacteria bacterium]|nr:threonylcarbamoyl-AMP synthase [Alphaproteobacteria bacterium]